MSTLTLRPSGDDDIHEFHGLIQELAYRYSFHEHVSSIETRITRSERLQFPVVEIAINLSFEYLPKIFIRIQFFPSLDFPMGTEKKHELMVHHSRYSLLAFNKKKSGKGNVEEMIDWLIDQRIRGYSAESKLREALKRLSIKQRARQLRGNAGQQGIVKKREFSLVPHNSEDDKAGYDAIVRYTLGSIETGEILYQVKSEKGPGPISIEIDQQNKKLTYRVTFDPLSTSVVQLCKRMKGWLGGFFEHIESGGLPHEYRQRELGFHT